MVRSVSTERANRASSLIGEKGREYEALAYAAWRLEERDVELATS